MIVDAMEVLAVHAVVLLLVRVGLVVVVSDADDLSTAHDDSPDMLRVVPLWGDACCCRQCHDVSGIEAGTAGKRGYVSMMCGAMHDICQSNLASVALFFHCQ